MFLKKVYNYSRGLFLFMALFVIAQLFVNFKQGMLLSPFYHFGMYSEPFKLEESYNVFEVRQNGKLLQGKDFSAQQWDKILLPIAYYADIKTNNILFEKEVKRILAKLHVAPDQKQFLETCDYNQFENWYKTYLQNITAISTTSIDVTSRLYTFKEGRLQTTSSVTLLSQLCR
jgi:hypothetical protein